MDDASGEIVSNLIDLTEVDLADLEALDNQVLATALQKIRDEVKNPSDAAAGFQSSV